MSEIRLDVRKIQGLVDPILSKLVNNEQTGMFDEIVVPLQELAKPLPGISDISKKDVTILVSSSFVLISRLRHQSCLTYELYVGCCRNFCS